CARDCQQRIPGVDPVQDRRAACCSCQNYPNKNAFGPRKPVYGGAQMKIALLHYSTWPEMGGVENVIRDQAKMLLNAGHKVKVLTGRGLDTKEGYEFVLV